MKADTPQYGSVDMFFFTVPDMSVRGTLSRLSAAVDLSQYRLIRGLLSFNIGECLDDVDVLTSDMSFNTPPQHAIVRNFC